MITDTMINNIENKMENLLLQECSLKIDLLEFIYFARNIYETETVNSELCYLEDFFENNIV